MNNKNIDVTNCYNCPLRNSDMEEGYSCNFPLNDVDYNEMNDYYSTKLPNKCPLKNTVITIKLRN